MDEENVEKHITDEELQKEVQPPSVKKSPGPFQVIGSILAAMFGVQSDENRERDFNSGSMSHYIFVGVIVVAIFVFSLIAIVNNILEDAGM